MSTREFNVRHLAISIATVLALSLTAPAQETWLPEVLPNPSGFTGAKAMGLSHDGTIIVGTAELWIPGVGMQWQAVKWTASGAVLLPHPPGFTYSWASDVSADGTVIIGTGWDGSQQRAIKWGPNEIEVLPSAGFFHTVANGVSADGKVVVGWISDQYYYNSRATKWSEIGLTVLPPAIQNNYVTQAIDVSDDGSTIIGYGGYKAWKWDSMGITELPALPNGNVYSVNSVNVDGSVIVGWGPVSRYKALKWLNGNVSALPEPSNSFGTEATSVNYDGTVIVGRGWNSGNFPLKWGPEGLSHLPIVPGVSPGQYATRVSQDGGVVVGQGSSGNNNVALKWRGFGIYALRMSGPSALTFNTLQAQDGDSRVIITLDDVEYEQDLGFQTVAELEEITVNLNSMGVPRFNRSAQPLVTLEVIPTGANSPLVAWRNFSVPLPIILVPGIDPLNQNEEFDELVEFLQENAYGPLQQGYGSPEYDNIEVLRYNRNTDSLSVAAGKLREAVNRMKVATYSDQVNIMGYSKGGLVARAYLTEYPLSHGANLVAFVATPNTGSTWAVLTSSNYRNLYPVYPWYRTTPFEFYSIPSGFDNPELRVLNNRRLPADAKYVLYVAESALIETPYAFTALSSSPSGIGFAFGDWVVTTRSQEGYFVNPNQPQQAIRLAAFRSVRDIVKIRANHFDVWRKPAFMQDLLKRISSD